jgi:hypothetical protein
LTTISENSDFSRNRLDQMIDLRHLLASRMSWQEIKPVLEQTYRASSLFVAEFGFSGLIRDWSGTRMSLQIKSLRISSGIFALAVLIFCFAADAVAQTRTDSGSAESFATQSNSELAYKVQNPLADMISFPLQSNLNLNTKTGTVSDNLNIEPIVPIHLDSSWNVITRTILPLQWDPSTIVDRWGAQPVNFSAYLSPKDPVNGWVFGAGPQIQIPTASGPTLGSPLWGIGAAFIVAKTAPPFVFTLPIYAVSSIGNNQKNDRYSTFYVNPTINYNISNGWFLASSPIITANWTSTGTKWSVPLGAGIGRVFRLPNGQPVAFNVGIQYYVVRPVGSSDVLVRAQLNFLFP